MRILIAFLAYSLQVTLKHRLLIHASGLTPTAVLEKLASIQMIDVWVPTTDGRWLILPRYTRPEKAPACCSRNSAWTCPPNRLLALPLIHPPPKRLVKKPFCGEDLSIALTESKVLTCLDKPQLRKSGYFHPRRTPGRNVAREQHNHTQDQ